jgi:hypothetical protein
MVPKLVQQELSLNNWHLRSDKHTITLSHYHTVILLHKQSYNNTLNLMLIKEKTLTSWEKLKCFRYGTTFSWERNTLNTVKFLKTFWTNSGKNSFTGTTPFLNHNLHSFETTLFLVELLFKQKSQKKTVRNSKKTIDMILCVCVEF